MLFKNAAVHDDRQPRRARPGGRFLVDDAFLHPDGARAGPDGRLDDLRHVLGAAEDVHDIHFFGHGVKRWVRLLAQDLGLLRVDRNDPVAGPLHVFGDAVAWPAHLSRQPDYGDYPRLLQ